MKSTISEEKITLVRDMNCEGVGIRSMSRLLKISSSSVQRKLVILNKQVVQPIFIESNQEYEIDELRTYISNKKNECWIIYAINKTTRQVIDFAVGKRTKENIQKIVDAVLLLSPKRIFTDRLNIFPRLIEKAKHHASAYRINHIERRNLNLRKDQKYLNRKTICYAKSEEMIVAKLKIYFFSNSNFHY
jgi:IS1 family transposase